MAKDPAFLFYPGDWQGGTSTMTRFLKGCYMDLLIAQFNSGPLSLEEIKTVLGSDFGVWPTLQKKFTSTPQGLFFNARLETEKEKRKQFTDSRKNNLLGTKNKKAPHMGKHMGGHMENENRNENETKKGVQGEELEMPFKTENFKIKWSAWIDYRKEIGKPYKSIKSQQAALKQLSEFDEDFSCGLIERSMSNGYQGLIFGSTKQDFLLYKNGKKSNNEGSGNYTTALQNW